MTLKTKFWITLFFCSFTLNLSAQHTFSIVAVDTATGEIGSAGATCGDSIIWPGTKGALVISDILPGVGAIHTQSYYLLGNQLNARDRMKQGDSPQDIIDWLILNDVAGDSTSRQYGIVDFNKGNPRSAGFTGSNCMAYRGHKLGYNYAIQGNILLGPQILDSMEARFLRADGCLADRLMEAMQGANVEGADSRCKVEGTSSLSSFLRVAKPDNRVDSLYIDLVVAGTPFLVDPIDTLQVMYNAWKQRVPNPCSPVGSVRKQVVDRSFPMHYNADARELTFYSIPEEVDDLTIVDFRGVEVLSYVVKGPLQDVKVSTKSLKSGVYFVLLNGGGSNRYHSKVVIY